MDLAQALKLEEGATLAGVKPGSSSASSVCHSECTRGCAPDDSSSTGDSLARCAGAKSAAAAGTGAARSPGRAVNRAPGGGGAPAGSSGHAARSSAGMRAHSRSASSSACPAGHQIVFRCTFQGCYSRAAFYDLSVRSIRQPYYAPPKTQLSSSQEITLMHEVWLCSPPMTSLVRCPWCVQSLQVNASPTRLGAAPVGWRGEQLAQALVLGQQARQNRRRAALQPGQQRGGGRLPQERLLAHGGQQRVAQPRGCRVAAAPPGLEHRRVAEDAPQQPVPCVRALRPMTEPCGTLPKALPLRRLVLAAASASLLR